ncbi:MAG: M23 family metallopeptidase [Deltaproteobacteria bacterium]|nr:MAG: M23 family metallopeptidase [Deltaproteobacteria bacterium]
MKMLFSLFLILFSTQIFSAEYAFVEMRDGSFRWGELVERYEDRWFYEPAGEHVASYILLFKTKEGKPQVDFLNENEIKKSFSFSLRNSFYKSYLKEKNLYFKNKVVENADVLTGNEGHHKHEKMFGNFAWDLGMLDERGSQFRNQGFENQDYYIFGKEVLAPLSGTVVGKVDGEEDNLPSPNLVGDLSGKVNNYLTILADYPFYVSLVHFKKNTISVNVGDKVEAGQILGEVGNSGVSYVPHLHYTLYLYLESFDRFISVPGFFEE